MSIIIANEFPLNAPKLIDINNICDKKVFLLMLVDEENNKQVIIFEDHESDKNKCLMKRVDPEDRKVTLYSEVYLDEKFNSMIHFLSDVTSQFHKPPIDATLWIKVIHFPTQLFDIPYIQHINRYRFNVYNSLGFIEFLDQVDPTKEIRIYWLPRSLQRIFFKTIAFQKLKHIKIFGRSHISAYDFLESQAEIIEFGPDSQFDEEIVLKWKKWVTEDVEYKSMRICGWNDRPRDLQALLVDLPVMDQIDNNGITEYILQRSDGTVAKVYMTDGNMYFENMGKAPMMIKKNEPTTGNMELPIKMLEKIATYFDIKTQRRFAQTSSKANEIATKFNRIWPKLVVYRTLTIRTPNNHFDINFCYDSKKCDHILISRDREGNKKLGKNQMHRYCESPLPRDTDLEELAKKIIMERLMYLENDCTHRTIVTIEGKWPDEEILQLMYYKQATRYILHVNPRSEDNAKLMMFLDKVDAAREIVLTPSMYINSILDATFFESNTFRRLKQLDIEVLCRITNVQFVDCEAEVLQITVESIMEAAVRRKIRKWYTKQQNIKYFGIRLTTQTEEFSVDEILEEIEYEKKIHEKLYKDVFGYGYEIRRDDGKTAQLFMLKTWIVFTTFESVTFPRSIWDDLD